MYVLFILSPLYVLYAWCGKIAMFLFNPLSYVLKVKRKDKAKPAEQAATTETNERSLDLMTLGPVSQ